MQVGAHDRAQGRTNGREPGQNRSGYEMEKRRAANALGMGNGRQMRCRHGPKGSYSVAGFSAVRRYAMTASTVAEIGRAHV